MNLKRLNLAHSAMNHYMNLMVAGQTDLVCKDGYVAHLVTSSYESRVGIEYKSGEVYWFPDVTRDRSSLVLIRSLMGL
jgi:hypothetical protein